MNPIKTGWLCLVAGKSAGHILPAITLGKQRQAQNSALKISFISNQSNLDYQTVQANPIVERHLALNLMPIPTRRPWLWPQFGCQLLKACWQTWRFLRLQRPVELISTGGLIAIPVYLVAKLLRIPNVIYELNVVPGKATQFLAKLGAEIKICFAQTAQFLAAAKCTLVDYPNRFTAADYQLTKRQALDLVQNMNPNFKAQIPTLLILGGSQGSLFINQLSAQLITQFKPATNILMQVIHQTGQQDQTNWTAFYAQHQIPALVFSYESNLMPYYKLADLIICRAGAGTLAEIAPLQTNCIIIPLQTTYTDHQVANALAIARQYSTMHVLTQDLIAQDMQIFNALVHKTFIPALKF